MIRITVYDWIEGRWHPYFISYYLDKEFEEMGFPRELLRFLKDPKVKSVFGTTPRFGNTKFKFARMYPDSKPPVKRNTKSRKSIWERNSGKGGNNIEEGWFTKYAY